MEAKFIEINPEVNANRKLNSLETNIYYQNALYSQ